jgi:hypothetical protein
MEWLNTQVSLYNSHADTVGKPVTFRRILFTELIMKHNYRDPATGARKGPVSDFSTIAKLRQLDKENPGYDKISKPMKATMQCFSPAAWLDSRKKDNVKIHALSGLMQFDFDYSTTKDFDIDELKAAVFNLPFTAYCGKSCSGYGFYALIAISEPNRLKEYAEHCFEIFNHYGIPPDTTKGRNVNDLRYVSYDEDSLLREDPEPLKIKRFITPKKTIQVFKANSAPTILNNNGIINKALSEIASAMNGSRFETVRKWSYTLGGMIDNQNYLNYIKDTIKNSSQYAGYEGHCFKTAEDAFEAGSKKPLTK